MSLRPAASGPAERAGWLIPATLLVLTLLLPGAAGHAILSSAEPAPNTRVDEAPQALELTFSEPLEDTYTRIQVLDANDTDQALDNRIHEDDRRAVTVPLPSLEDGLYTVHWRTLSSADGHTRSGVYFLAINTSLTGGGAQGPTPGNVSADASGQAPPGVLEPVFRGLGFAGASLAVGLPLALLLTVGLTVPRSSRQRLILAAGGSAGLAAVAGLGLAWQTAVRIESSVPEALATANGQVLLLRIGLLGLTAAAFLVAGRLRAPELKATGLALGLLSGLAALLATSLGGHAAAETGHLAAAVVVDWTHQAAVAAWLGGVAALGWLLARGLAAPEAARLVRRFSPAAVASVAVIVVTGTIASFDRLPSPEALWRSLYGGALLVKILLVVPLVGFGAYHRFVLLPRIEGRAGPSGLSRLRRSVAWEAGVMAVVLLAAGLLTSLAPPLTAGPSEPPGQATDRPDHVFNGSDLQVKVYISPSPVTVGFQQLWVNVTPLSDQAPSREGMEVFLTLLPPSDPYGEASPRQGHDLVNDTWHFGGALFTEEGPWEATLTLQGTTYLQETFTVDVQRP